MGRQTKQTPSEHVSNCRKRKAEQTVNVINPKTPGQLRNRPKHKKYTESVIIKDENDRVLIWFQNGKIGKRKLDDLYNSTTWLETEIPIKPEETVRGYEKTVHVGSWRKYSKKPFITSVTKNYEQARDWIEINTPLFNSLGYMFKKSFKTLHSTYMSCEAPMRLGAWSTCAINFNYASKGHYDDDDYQNGLCWVVVFGDFEGGELYFRDLNITIAIRPGDVIAFRSFELFHEVREYTGQRYSIVMFQSQEMFFKSK